MAKGSNNSTGRRSSSRNAKPYDANNVSSVSLARVPSDRNEPAPTPTVLRALPPETDPPRSPHCASDPVRNPNPYTTSLCPRCTSTGSRRCHGYSFVKKVATKVTDLIPQKSWISKWFNTSQSDADVLDEAENPEEIESEEDLQKPPPLKRPCIRMDVTHPPGTFAIQPRTKTLLNNASPSKQQYSIHNETSQDFCEPAVAGPSGMSCLISSTPASVDIRNITPQRSELNSLVTATNNGTANGMDDNSESSESTSGCSSLIPQTNRQEAPSNVSYNSPFSNRKRFNNDKLSFTNHAQSPRSLFLDNSNRDSLSSRRPSFNASVMTNTPDRASPLSSPFYSGNITFGGANAAGLYQRGRSLFNSSNEIQLKVPRRTNVEVKPSNATGVDSSGMSQTAKKILEALEHFSSPVTDAKKIPIKMMNNTSLSKKRTREEESSPVTKVGLRHLTRELTVPTVPDILKLRRRQKLQDTTVAARRIISARSEPPPPQEYHFRTQADEETKHHGKVKGKTTNLEQEETVEPINLPNIPLPISSLPNFNFTPVNTKATEKVSTQNEEAFTFASPIKVTNTAKNLKSINNFTFSSPIKASEQTLDNFNDSNLSLKKIGAKSDSTSGNCTPIPTVAQNFVWSGTSTAPRPKEKSKSGDIIIPAVSNEFKSGSVMDILLPKSDKTETEKSRETQAQLNLNQNLTNNKANTIVLSTSKDDTKITNSISILQQDSSTMWECSECLIKNSESETQCFACKAAKPSSNNGKISEASSTLSSESKITTKGNFGSQFKLSSTQWECTSCFVRNKETDTKCVACTSLKPGSKCETKSNTSNLINSDLSKSSEGSWECSNCKLKNSANSTTCSCCKTSKLSSLSGSSKKDKTIVDGANTSSDQRTTASTNLPSSSTITKSESMDKFKPSKDTWECPCCMVRNSASVDLCPCCNTAKPNSGGATKNVPLLANGFGDQFKKPEGAWNCDACMLQNKAIDTECVACGASKPGSKKADNSSTTNNSSGLQFSFGIPPSTSGFKFGIDNANQQKTDSVTPMNGFKFGESQPTGQSGQFTFGIQKEETKSETPKSESSATSTVGSGFGLIVAKNNEKTDDKQASETADKKPTPSFLFSMPKSESGKVETNMQSAGVSSTAIPATFKFSVPKSDIKQTEIEKEKQSSFFGNTTTEVSKSVTEVTPATTASPLTTITQSSSQETKPASIFSFGVPSSTVASSNSTTTSVATSLPSSTQSSFAFPDSKPAQAASVSAFGQIPASVPSTSANTFTFGETKTSAGLSPPKTFNALSNNSSGSSLFSSISNAPSLFGASDAKTTAFGTQENKLPVFGAQENKLPAFGASKPSAFSMPENKVTTFESAENKPLIFGSTDAKLPAFGSTENKVTPLLNPTPQTPTVTPTPAFNAPAATPSLFGSSVTPVFDSNASTFPTDAKPNIFGSPSKLVETNKPASNLFTFNATPAQPVAQPATGFNFSANTNTATPNQKPLFTFGSGDTTTPQNNTVFRGNFNSPAANNSGFTFNAPKPEASAFNQSTVTTSIFGAPQTAVQNQPSSSFAPAPANPGFNFGAAPPATSSGGFNFGAAPTSVPSTGFNFNPPSATPTFDPNSSPSFNFTGGNAPPVFNAAPQAMAQRRFKKAHRRKR